jgi:ankyrin repeat protein
LIEKYKANVNVQTHTQSTPLHQACENGCISVVNILLKHKADVSMTTIRNSTAMHCAAAAWSKPILEALSHHIAELSRRTGKTLASYVEHINLFGQTPLDVARSYYRSVPLTREQRVAQADTIAFLTSISAHERDDIHRPYR